MIDYYRILNISHNATKQEIKEAFKKEALKWHPDRNKSVEATQRMQLINEAYLILYDDEARKRYDEQYFKFKNSNYQEKPNYNQKQYNWENYSSDDEVLNDWIKKAKEQAKEMLFFSIEDLVGMTKAATSAAWEKTKWLILIVIVGNILAMMLMNN